MKMRPQFLHFTLISLVFGFCHQLSAQDWPQWRGPNRMAAASNFQAPDTWPETLHQQWKVTVGDGVATPSLVGNKLYVFTRENGEEVIRCLKAGSGKELWKNQYPSLGAEGGASRYSGPRSSPTVAQGKVVTCGVRGTLSCLDAETGQVLWRKQGTSQGWPRFFVSSSPIVTGSTVISQFGDDDEGGIAAYDLESGEEKWTWTGSGTAYASPILHRTDRMEMIVAETSSDIVGLDAATGRLLWKEPFRAEGRSYNTATPIIQGNTLYYSGSGRGTYAAALQRSGDAYSLKPVWHNEDATVRFNTPVLKGDYLYGLTDRNVLFCLNASTGETAWTQPFPSADSAPEAAQSEDNDDNQGRRRGRGRRGGGGGFGSIVDAGSVLVALTPEAQLVAFKPSGQAFQQVAMYQVADEGTHAYPVLSGKRIFIKDNDSVALWTLP